MSARPESDPAQRPSGSVASGALALETRALTKRFGAFTALAGVTLKVAPGSVHALLGANGAGKSTLVKCIAGALRPDGGSIAIDGRERAGLTPALARSLGIGMVYQHFTLAPTMSVAENLLLAGGRLPAVIDWPKARARLAAFLATTPFKLALDATPASLSAGEKQKLELLKQLYLKPRLLILDEPTAVLTPREAGELLAFVRAVAGRGECTVLLISHKLREVMAYADQVTVLRQGERVHDGAVARTTPLELAEAMVGGARAAAVVAEGAARARAAGDPAAPIALEVSALVALGDRGAVAVRDLSLAVRRGEILGIAGVAGNGQRELVEAIVGQRPRAGGSVRVAGRPYFGRRAENRALGVRALTDEPLRNASVGALGVAANMALRDFDEPPLSRQLLPGIGWLRLALWRARARQWMAAYAIEAGSETAPLQTLSGGHVQRTLLARELAGARSVLIAVNPVAGLDVAAVREVHARIAEVRARGTAVLMVSEDLDELLALCDRIVVMSEGLIVFETPAAAADRATIGAHMGGDPGAAPADGTLDRCPSCPTSASTSSG